MRKLTHILIFCLFWLSASGYAQLAPTSQSYHYVTGATGVLFKVFPNSQTNPPAYPINLLGSVDLLICVPVPPTAGVRQLLSLVPSSDGSYASRLSQAGDFPSAGEYNCELLANWGNTQVIPSPAFNFFVAPAL
jgi:hypothetical protein